MPLWVWSLGLLASTGNSTAGKDLGLNFSKKVQEAFILCTCGIQAAQRERRGLTIVAKYEVHYGQRYQSVRALRSKGLRVWGSGGFRA